MSPDGKHVAYLAQSAGKWYLVVDGKESTGYPNVRGGTLKFSPDNRHVVYVGAINGNIVLVVDDKPGTAYDEIFTRGTGKIVFDGPSRVHYLAAKQSKVVLVEEQLK
jgi:hypothetical protein